MVRLSLPFFAILASVCTSVYGAAVAAPGLKTMEEHVLAVRAQAKDAGIDLSAIPAWKAVPELGLEPIVPGEGLPTLEELGWSWDRLMTVDIEEKTEVTSKNETGLEKRYTPNCHMPQNASTRLIPTVGAGSCYAYLYNLPTYTCPGYSTSYRYCTAGAIAWNGKSLNLLYTSSNCRDVAKGGEWVEKNCFQISPGVITRAAGSNAAWGNGNLIVSIVQS